MRALVTGSSGFIGRNFVRHLRKKGWSVLEVDIRDPRDPLECRKFFHVSRIHFDLAIHCAAVIPDIESRTANPMPMAANIEMDSAYLQWCLHTWPTQVVYFSSSAAYPIDLNLPGHALVEDDIDLDDLRQADGIYGFAKLVGEVQAREARREGLDILVLRPQSGYAADQSMNYPFPSLIDRVRNRCDPLTVWGSGNQARDFIHVDDVVEATMKMLEDGEQGPINLASGTPTTMLELARKMVDTVPDYDPTIVTDESKPQGASYRYGDPERMLKYHKPDVTLEEGIRRALGL